MCCACTHFDWTESVEEGWVEGSSSERVSVETLGNAWFYPDGPSLSQGEQTRIHSLADFDELDVIEAGDLVAVWVELAAVSLRVYLERIDLGSRVIASTSVSGLEVEANQVVQILDHEADQVLIEVGDRDVWAEAWVPAVAVDQVWNPTPQTVRESIRPDRWLRGNTEVLDGPLGTPFAWVDSFSTRETDQSDVFWLPAVALSEPVDGFQKLRLEREGFVIEGFVSVNDVAQFPNGSRGFGSHRSECGRVDIIGTEDDWTVPAGTDLFLGPHGPWVGRTHSPIVQALETSDPDSWRSFEQWTPWGLATVWVAPEVEESGKYP